MVQTVEDAPAGAASTEPAAHLGLADHFDLRAVSAPSITPDGHSIAFVVTQADRESDTQLGHVWVCDGGGPPRQLTRGERGEAAPAWSPDGSTLAFIAARGAGAKPQVWLLPSGGGEARALTSAPLGVAEFRWSPDGATVAYTAPVDTTGEERREAAPVVVRRLDHKSDGVGRVGGLRIHLFVVGVDGGDARQLTSGDHSVAGVAWSADSRRLVFSSAMHADRDLNPAQHLYVLDASGGEPRRLTPDGWVAGAALWSADAGEVIFVGSPGVRVLQASLFAVPAAGGAPRDLLVGFDRNVMPGGPAYPGSLPQLAADGGSIVFSARVRGCTHLFSVPCSGGVPQHLFGDDTTLVAGASVAAQSSRVALVAATPLTPGDLVQLDLDNGQSHRLTDLNAALLAGRRVSIPESRRATAPDGLEVESWLWRAPHAHAPLVVDIHGGPHNASTPTLSPLLELWRQEMVSRGCSVLAVNARGSDGYGAEFMGGAVGGWGELDFADIMAAVDEVVDAGIADPQRLAVTGYSYGGFMTSWIVGHTDRFRAAVAGGVVTDLASMYGTSDVGAAFLPVEVREHLIDDPQLYARLSPLTYAERVTTPTLILHGEADLRCPVGQAEEFFTALRHLGREVEMVLYPGGNHLFVVSGRPSHIVDFGTRIVDWVTGHLDTGAPAAG